MAGQSQLPNPVPAGFALGVDCTDLNVIDPSGLPSNLILEAGAGFNVSARFVLGGALAPFFIGPIAGATPFTVTYYYEGMGGAPDGVLGNASGTTSAGSLAPGTSNVYEYQGAVTTPPALVTLPAPGLYKLSAVVTFGGGFAFTAFVDGPMVQQK